VKVSREQAAENRERILDAATQRFRERGFAGIGVADLMKEAGLTHGGFYGHFASKEDLIAQACARASDRSRARWARLSERAPDNPLAEIARVYLTPQHRDSPGAGCLIAALGPDVARQGPAVRDAVTAGVRAALDFLSRIVPGRSRAAKRRKAIASYASMVGGMVLARAVNDRVFSKEILDAVEASIRS
jgi:TetR/AcrR family transcriptional regulator, transcriptional repressor for nem operon